MNFCDPLQWQCGLTRHFRNRMVVGDGKTRLSKIKTLRLATSYIGYLMTVLESDDPGAGEMGFRAELVHSGGGRRATVDRPTMDRRTTADNSMVST
ncbi:unnamed protein product, partial [Timema podura]|nr:unnamed protein product [Timema podura]